MNENEKAHTKSQLLRSSPLSPPPTRTTRILLIHVLPDLILNEIDGEIGIHIERFLERWFPGGGDDEEISDSAQLGEDVMI